MRLLRDPLPLCNLPQMNSVNSTSAIATQAVADKNTSRANANKHARPVREALGAGQLAGHTFSHGARALAARIKAHPAYTVALGSLLGIEAAQDTTDLTTSKPTLAGVDQTGGVVELDFDKSISDGVNIYAKRDGDADFVFLARDTASPYIDNRPLLVATKSELREYKAVYVQSDAEIGLFSDEVVVNCAPLV